MKILDKKGFKLPYVDSQTYRDLLRLGLLYDKQLRSYSAEGLDEIRGEAVRGLLSRILHEQVCFEQPSENSRNIRAGQTCLICSKGFACDECRYFELCETKNVPSNCVCGKCLEEGKVF
jgi:hypothetical protein